LIFGEELRKERRRIEKFLLFWIFFYKKLGKFNLIKKYPK